jgi:hypothetical protein
MKIVEFQEMESQMKDAVRQILGKTIKGVIASEENRGGPRTQVFLLFDDDTYYEFYGNQVTASGGVDRGCDLDVVRYAQKFGGRITRFDKPGGIMEPAEPPQQQEPRAEQTPDSNQLKVKGQIWGYDQENQKVDLQTWSTSLPPGGYLKVVESQESQQSEPEPHMKLVK